jgi:hypothetical protein
VLSRARENNTSPMRARSQPNWPAGKRRGRAWRPQRGTAQHSGHNLRRGGGCGGGARAWLCHGGAQRRGAGAAATAGGLTAGLIGALGDWGIPEARIRQYEAGIRDGGIMMMVEARFDDDVRQIEQEWKTIGTRRILLLDRRCRLLPALQVSGRACRARLSASAAEQGEKTLVHPNTLVALEHLTCVALRTCVTW